MPRRLGFLAALLALACIVQTWMIAHAVVPAQDAVRYVLLAQSYHRNGLLAGLRDEVEHPLFPMLVWLTHAGSAGMTGDPDNWAICAQLAAAAMLVISVALVYLLLLEQGDPSLAVAGTLFYCLMTAVARLGADALTDSTQLALYVAALYAIARWGRTAVNPSSRYGTWEWLFAAGLLIGLAMLARPEATILIPALLLTIGLRQLSTTHRRPWLHISAGIAGLALGWCLIQIPYGVITRSYDPQSIVARTLGKEPPPAQEVSPVPSAKWRTPDGNPMEFGIKDRSVSRRFQGYSSATFEYLREFPEATQYWIGGLAVVGLWGMRRVPWKTFDYFACVLFALHSLATIHIAAGVGYLSARHLLPLTPLLLAPAAYGALHVGRGFWNYSQRTGRIAGWAAVALAAVGCLPRTLAPLHPTRIGHRQAGQWLARAEQPGAVLDTRGWTALYSGRTTLRYDAAKTAYRRPDLAFVVIEQRELDRDSPRARTMQHLLAGAAEPVEKFCVPGGRSGDDVLIYRWRPERFTDVLRLAQSKL